MISSDETSARQGERGALMVEYAAVLAFIALVAVVTLTTFGISIVELYSDNMNDFGRAISRKI